MGNTGRAPDLLHGVRDIECKYGVLEWNYRGILHRSTTDCTAASVRGEMTVKRGRINGGKLIISLSYLCNCRIINNFSPSDSTKYVRLVEISSRTKRLPV